MKLLRLKLNAPFSSLTKGFELRFRESFSNNENEDWNNFLPYCFAGLNGSGKSNVLEALANIFFHLEGCVNVNQPENFTDCFSERESFPNAYELEYFILPKYETEITEQKMVKVRISKKDKENPIMKILSFPFNDEVENQEIPVLANKAAKIVSGAKQYLPDLVIAYSSGENEVLSIPFLKTRLLHYDEYISDLKGKTKFEEPESKLIYIDYEMSQAVLLSNYIFQESKVLEPIQNELKIVDIKRFRMNLNIHDIDGFNILEQYSNRLKAFKNCATAYYESESNLTLDFWINSCTKEAFKKNFKDAFDLFQSFQILYTLNYRIVEEDTKAQVYESKGYYTGGKMPYPSPEERVFHFLDYYIEKSDCSKLLLLKNLSDGEQQFLHTMGICLMLKDKRALLLLDEPETHFNPNWRSKFISTLQKSLEASGSNNLNQDIIITSHSPFIISDCFPDKVIIFQKGKRPINARDTNFRTYGTSIDIITENIFKNNNTIGDLSRSEIEAIQEDIKGKKKLTEDEVVQYKENLSHLGDSMEKIMLFAQLNELKRK